MIGLACSSHPRKLHHFVGERGPDLDEGGPPPGRYHPFLGGAGLIRQGGSLLPGKKIRSLVGRMPVPDEGAPPLQKDEALVGAGRGEWVGRGFRLVDQQNIGPEKSVRHRGLTMHT